MFRTPLIEAAERIRKIVHSMSGHIKGRSLCGVSHGGDPQYDVDQHAEQAAKEAVRELLPEVAIFTEDAAMVQPFGDLVAVIDPIDGTRSAAAGLEMATISIALAENRPDATLGNVCAALVMEIKTGAYVYVAGDGMLEVDGFKTNLPNLNAEATLDTLFWTMEFNGHPAALTAECLSPIIDRSASTGGVFVFNSATYSILKIITGQLDAYVDIGNRLLKDDPSLESMYRRVGAGSVLHLFPYDLAAIHMIAKASGVTIGDAYGQSLARTRLFDTSWQNQQSCIAASTPNIAKEIRHCIKWPQAIAA